MRARIHTSHFHTPTLLAAAIVSGATSLLVGRNFFGHSKRIHQIPEFSFGVEDSEFHRSIGGLLAPPFVRGNEVTTLENGSEIFPAMLAAIRSAQKSITFENFILHDGKVFESFADALEERAQAGVRVHFLQDGVGGDCLHGKTMRRLKKSKVEVEVFRFRNFNRFNLRTHRKLLVIDGRLGFIGGAGIADEWAGHGNVPEDWHDTHYRVEGPVVTQMQQAFTDNWTQTRGRLLYGDRYFPEIPEAGDKRCQLFKSGAGQGASNARLMFLLSIAAAKRSIHIANAYFVPDSLCLRALAEASRRGVSVEIMTPSERTDAPVVRAVSRTRWRRLLEAGVRMYEFQPTLLHCKYMVVDDCWVSVGSCNFDNRSMRLNDEANLNVLDTPFAAEHRKIFEADKQRCEEITTGKWRRRRMGERVIGRTAGLFRAQL